MKELVRLNKRSSRDGSAFTFVLRYTENGKRKHKALGHNNRKKAEKQRAQKEKELRMGYVEPSSSRLSDFMTDSLARTGDQIRESTRTDYREAMETFISIVGDMNYRMVQHTHGEFFRQACLDRGDSPATVAKKLKGLKRFFSLAVQRKQLDENPLMYVKSPRVPKQKIRIYSDDELDRIIRVASQTQKTSVLEWDIMITLATTTGMRKGELLNLIWSDIDFGAMTIDVGPKTNTAETWAWKVKDTDRRGLPLTEEVCQLLVGLQNRRPEGYPYVFVTPTRHDHIQVLRAKGKWTLTSAKDKVINNFTRQFNQIRAMAHVGDGTFHDIRKTAITNWFRQGLSEYDVMTLAGHANFSTTHRFYLAVADDLVDRARKATTFQVSEKLLSKCCQSITEGVKV